jgi:hypothetical protein
MRTFVRLSVVVLAVPSISQNAPVPLDGVVLTHDGKPIPGAFVLIRNYQQRNGEYVSDRWESRTAADGRFSFALPRGCYDFFVSANRQFLPLAQRICVQRDLRGLRIKLTADPNPSFLQMDREG